MTMPRTLPEHVPEVPWSELKDDFLHEWCWPEGKWQPEHLAVLGPTGSGKTHFTTGVLDERCRKGGAHAVIVATKPADKTVRRLISKGWALRRTWPPGYGEKKVIFWPKSGRPSDGPGRQRKAILDFLDELWKPDANTIVCFDEIAYLEQELSLRRPINKWWRESRALGITMVATTQRPRGVNRHMAAEPVWSVAFRPDDEDDASRTAEIIGGRKKYRDILMDLDVYEFLIIHRRKREAYRSRMEK